jgi:hypothetical protein
VSMASGIVTSPIACSVVNTSVVFGIIVLLLRSAVACERKPSSSIQNRQAHYPLDVVQRMTAELRLKL